MNVAFIGIKEPHQSFGHIGMEIIAELLAHYEHNVIGLTESTFDTSSFLTADEKRKLKALQSFNPDYVCFSILTHRYQWCLKFAALVKANIPSAKIVFGGPHASAVPDVVIAEDVVDIVCVGEGEYAMLELVTRYRTNIQNLWFKDGKRIVSNSLRPLIKDLDSLPFPKRSLWQDLPESEFNYYLLTVSRGCPYSCSYCQNNTYHKLYSHENIVRFRSVENVIAELKHAKKQYKIKWVLPLDDNLTLNPKWFKEFAEQYKKHINVPYCATTHPLTVDAERAELLKMSGCRFVKIGIQSGSEKVRMLLMNRHETNQQLLSAASICKHVKLKFTLDHIFGVDDSSEALHDSVDLYNTARPTQLNSFQLYFFPCTDIIVRKNLSPEDVAKINNGTYQSGSIKGHHNLPYRNLFTVLPLLPKKLVSAVNNNSMLMSFFTNIPEPILMCAKIATNIKLKNTPALVSNLKFLPHKFKERLRGYKGDFD